MNETKAARFQRLKRRTGAAGIIAGAVMLVLLVVTPGARLIAAWSSSLAIGAPAWVQGLVAWGAFVTCTVVLWELVAIPGALVAARARSRRQGRASGETLIEPILAAQAQATAIALVGALVVGVDVELSIVTCGGWWWVASGVGAAAMLAVALQLAPSLLARLGGAGPVSRRELADTLERLARAARVPVAGIDEWRTSETSTSAAIVAGMGRNRRIFVSREVIRDWTDDEIAVVVAHELAHHKHRDLWRTFAVDAVTLIVASAAAQAVLGAAAVDAADLASLPLIALVGGAVWLAATPLRHAQSRRQERAADEFALRLTGGSDAFIAALKRLSVRHLVEERPARAVRWLYHRHPTVAERLEAADRFAARAAAARLGPTVAADRR